MMTDTKAAELLEKNLLQVWNERDATKRRAVIESIYQNDATFFEGHSGTSGYDAINRKIGDTLQALPGDFVFRVRKPAQVNNNMARLYWGVGPADGPGAGTGMDIALFREGRIQALYVFLDEDPV
jgi:hypothetical protein